MLLPISEFSAEEMSFLLVNGNSKESFSTQTHFKIRDRSDRDNMQGSGEIISNLIVIMLIFL